MKTRYIIITLVCFALIGLLLLADRCFTVEPEPIEPPERDWGGLRVQQMVAEPEPSAEPELCFTEDDVIAVAKMLWGEARGCALDNQQKAVWCVLNRVDDPRFPDTIQGVLSQPSQFYGYSPNFPVTDELYAVALDVMTRWSMEKQGVTVERELPNTYLWFTGDGVQNWFREDY
jgi:cell wall hydrolase sleB